MNKQFFWARKAMLTGLGWGMGWLLLSGALMMVIGTRAADVPFPIGFGLFGLLCGMAFTAVEAAIHKATPYRTESMPAVATLGIIAGSLIGALLSVTILFLGAESFAILVMIPALAVASALTATAWAAAQSMSS